MCGVNCKLQYMLSKQCSALSATSLSALNLCSSLNLKAGRKKQPGKTRTGDSHITRMSSSRYLLLLAVSFLARHVCSLQNMVEGDLQRKQRTDLSTALSPEVNGVENDEDEKGLVGKERKLKKNNQRTYRYTK